jgi:hypothetical protein
VHVIRARLLPIPWRTCHEPGQSDQDCDRDGAWHRQGESAGTGTVGTDQIEYGLQALHAYRYDPAVLQDVYQRYRDLAVPASSRLLNPALSFFGYFRLYDNEPSRSQHFGSYYDIVGAGVLADFKREHFPEDFALAATALESAASMPSMVDCNLQPIWSTASDGTVFATQGTIPVAVLGSALLRATYGL